MRRLENWGVSTRADIAVPMFCSLCFICNDPYNCTGIIDRNLAEEIQKYMNINNTIFTDWMDKYHIDSIVFRIT